MITPFQARQIADNPDGATDSELGEFLTFVRAGTSYRETAAELWLDNEGNDSAARALIFLECYVVFLAKARKARQIGAIAVAQKMEQLAQQQYDRLPGWAKW